MNITFIGTGYVGLVSGVMMSYFGHNVTCLDTNSTKIAQLKSSTLPIYEPELEKYLTPAIKFIDHYRDIPSDTEAIFITVGTPSLPSGQADLSYVFAAADNLIGHLGTSNDSLIVVKSTVPPGTCNKLQSYLAAKNSKLKIATNPEFLREGMAVKDFLNPDRVIVGINNREDLKILEALYKPLIKKNIPFVVSDLITAETIKYASNSFLAAKIAFINEMADLCEIIGADIEKLAYGIGLDHRIGKDFLKAGPGFGGSCFPKDILALATLTKDCKVDGLILNAVITANERRPGNMINKISTALGGSLANKKIAVLGLAFKAGTDDVRSSPAIEIIKLLQERQANIVAYDPIATTDLTGVMIADSPIEACNGADALVIVTEWQEFERLDFEHIHKIMKNRVIIDLRNMLDSRVLAAMGFEYYGVGK